MALTKKLEAVADSIRSKTGSTEKMTLDEMKDAIDGIGSVPAPPDEAFVLTGDCQSRFAREGWTWFIEQYGDQITTENITDLDKMFYRNYSLKEIPFSLNATKNSSVSLNNLCTDCFKLKKVPYINGAVSDAGGMFYRCQSISEIPEDWLDGLSFDYIHRVSNSGFYQMFYGCYGLKTIPPNIIKELYGPWTRSWSAIYAQGFRYCNALSGIHELTIHRGSVSSNNMFDYMVGSCSRLSELTFKLSSGTSVKWTNQTITVAPYVGYAYSDSVITNYSHIHGITAATQVTDDASYQALKDNPDWWTADIAYSRYNHDSAVETINSLPDTSEYLVEKGGTNTIKFEGAAGSKTDGGAINTLTEEEIAVAAAKGWTCTFV